MFLGCRGHLLHVLELLHLQSVDPADERVVQFCWSEFVHPVAHNVSGDEFSVEFHLILPDDDGGVLGHLFSIPQHLHAIVVAVLLLRDVLFPAAAVLVVHPGAFLLHMFLLHMFLLHVVDDFPNPVSFDVHVE